MDTLLLAALLWLIAIVGAFLVLCLVAHLAELFIEEE